MTYKLILCEQTIYFSKVMRAIEEVEGMKKFAHASMPSSNQISMLNKLKVAKTNVNAHAMSLCQNVQ